MFLIKKNYTVPTPFDDFFDSLMNHNFDLDEPKVPVHDVIENDNEYLIEMLLSGVKKEDIKIDSEDDVLTIQAERKKNNKLKYNRQQTYFGKYKRSFILPEDVDKSKIDANLSDGVLKITLNKLKPKKDEPKKISIEIN
ncbi:MAG: Hsp20/alpha crystallin family protein [bacterium]